MLAPILVSGCADGYSRQESCVDLASSVWPWETMDEHEATSFETPGILPEHLVVVTGTFHEIGTYGRPVDAAFQCVYRGGLLQSFGWAQPPMLADPDFPLGGTPTGPVGGAS